MDIARFYVWFCVWANRALFEPLKIINTNPTMKSTVKVELSTKPLIVNKAGPTMRKKPAMAVSLASVLTGILKADLIPNS